MICLSEWTYRIVGRFVFFKSRIRSHITTPSCIGLDCESKYHWIVSRFWWIPEIRRLRVLQSHCPPKLGNNVSRVYYCAKAPRECMGSVRATFWIYSWRWSLAGWTLGIVWRCRHTIPSKTSIFQVFSAKCAFSANSTDFAESSKTSAFRPYWHLE